MRMKCLLLAVPSLLGLFTVGNTAFAKDLDDSPIWIKTSAPSNNWAFVASSWNGINLVAAGFSDPSGNPGLIYTSRDGGESWRATSAPSNYWGSALTSSADGRKLVAGVAGNFSGSAPPVGPVLISSDAGETWSQTSLPSNSWFSVCSSADGRKLAVAPNYDRNAPFPNFGSLYTSSDAGETWMQSGAPSNSWEAVACSVDGHKLAAWAFGTVDSQSFYISNSGSMYTSRNAGASWTESSSPAANWAFGASSGNGRKLAGVAYNFGNPASDNSIFISTDEGLTWKESNFHTNWFTVAYSVDGSLLAAATSVVPGSIYISRNDGATWTDTGAPLSYWNGVAVSADGNKLVAVPYQDANSNPGAIYTLDLGERVQDHGSYQAGG